MATDKLVDFDHVTDYISREECIKDLREYEETALDGLTVIGCMSRIKRIPAADVRPVERGTWEGETGFFYAELSQRVICGKCGAYAYFYDKLPMNFCPNCGADMREETE